MSDRVAQLLAQHERLSDLFAEMHTTGIWVNSQWRSFMLSCVEQSIEEKKEKLAQLVRHPGWTPTPNAMRALIYKRHASAKLARFNLPDPFDKKMYSIKNPDNISVDERRLLMLMVSGTCPPDLLPIIEAWWEYQGEAKRRGTLKSHLFDEAIGSDNRLRPGWNSCGTDTGRIACSAPNVMNIEQTMRAMFGPPPGHVWVHADQAQLEIRVMALVASDNELQDAIDSGDVYAYGAKSTFDLDCDVDAVKKLYPGQRKAQKIIHLGRQYGAGIKTILGQALRQDRRFTLSRAQALVKAWDKTFYRTAKYWDEEMNKVMERGFSESLLMNRRRSYPRPPDRSEVANYPVQSTAADIMNTAILELWDRLRLEVPKARIVTQLHDAIDVEAPEKYADEVSRIMKEVMNGEQHINGRVGQFEVELKVASHWDTWAAV